MGLGTGLGVTMQLVVLTPGSVAVTHFLSLMFGKRAPSLSGCDLWRFAMGWKSSLCAVLTWLCGALCRVWGVGGA